MQSCLVLGTELTVLCLSIEATHPCNRQLNDDRNIVVTSSKFASICFLGCERNRQKHEQNDTENVFGYMG